ncbi:MAG: hypothetical protein RMK29_00940 [Myxococcales bacterium]|nr:hypothetical protein [Myxococcota bacterium]MDW8280244.1 hypothetical protein [Myxococcales bacterium]
MGQYHFDMPEGWEGVPLPPPQAGVQIRPREPQSPSSRAVIVLLGPVPPEGGLRDTLEQMVQEGNAGAQVVRRGDTLPFRSAAYPGLLTAVRLRVPSANGAPVPDEGRIYAVLDAGQERIPVVFAGGPEALPMHRAALDTVLSSLRPYVGGEHSPFSGWSG